jgi:hypothetical protein
MRISGSADMLEAEFIRLAPEEIIPHSLAVARRCQEAGGEALFWAGLLHDIGKSPEIARTGFHPLDGAHHMLALGEPDLACLVARHSGAEYEAAARGISLRPWQEDQFPEEQKILDRIDLTTLPSGQEVSFQQRLADITSRYGENSVEASSLREIGPKLFALESGA